LTAAHGLESSFNGEEGQDEDVKARRQGGAQKGRRQASASAGAGQASARISTPSRASANAQQGEGLSAQSR